MFKHECVECLKAHNLKCIWNIRFIDIFLGNNKVKYCVEYNNILKYKKRYNKKVKIKNES